MTDHDMIYSLEVPELSTPSLLTGTWSEVRVLSEQLGSRLTEAETRSEVESWLKSWYATLQRCMPRLLETLRDSTL